MATVTIPGHYHVEIPVSGTSNSVMYVTRGIHANIESEKPVHVYVVDEFGLAAYQSGKQFTPLFSAEDVQSLDKNVARLRRKGETYYVLIVNPRDTGTAVHYEISA